MLNTINKSNHKYNLATIIFERLEVSSVDKAHNVEEIIYFVPHWCLSMRGTKVIL